MNSEYNPNKRFYRKILPNINDKVVCKCINISYDGCIVNLPEYGNISALIPYKELSKTRIKNITSFIKKGKTFIAEVINIDSDKLYVDLSKKSVNKNEEIEAENYYNKSKRVNSVIKRVSELSNISAIEFYDKYIWNLYDNFEQHPDDILYNYYNSNKICNFADILPTEIMNHFNNVISKTYSNKKVNLLGKLSITCIGIEGINAIKNTLNKIANEYPNISISLFSTPNYIYQLYDDNTLDNVNLVNSAMNKTIEYIKEYMDGDGKIIEICKLNNENEDKLIENSLLENDSEEKSEYSDDNK